ncbi:MAG: hypothetical protein ACM3UZ_06175 [Acidobacteriota bacterium]
MTNQGSEFDSSFEVRLVVKDTRALDLKALAEQTQKHMKSLARIRLDKVQLRKYGMYMTGYGPVADMVRIAESIYPLTAEGGIVIIIKVGEREEFVIKDGNILDCNNQEFRKYIPAELDEAQPTEEELNRLGF